MRYLFIALILLSCSSRKSEIVNEGSVSIPVEDTASTILDPSSVAEPSDECLCSNVRAYLIDPDKSGTNIRETPRGNIVGKLKYDEDCDCQIVRFVESKDGWMRLEDGGWVYGELFEVASRNYAEGEKVYLYESTTEESGIVAEYVGEQLFKIKGCCGSWLFVEIDGIVGWLPDDMSCGNPLTNCS